MNEICGMFVGARGAVVAERCNIGDGVGDIYYYASLGWGRSRLEDWEYTESH